MRPLTREWRRAFRLRSSVAVLALLAAWTQAGDVFGATIAVEVQTADGRPLPGAVLTLRSLGGSDRPHVPVQAVMDQIDRAFQPDLLVVPVGSTVEFPNSDSVSHQIYSFSPAKRFQLPLYRGKPYPPVHFDEPGTVTLGCNIHDSMLAYILVTDAPYFGRTDAAGSWSADVPRGTYRVAVWHPRLHEEGELERQMTIGEGDRTVLTLRLAKPLRPAPLQGNKHSWDAY